MKQLIILILAAFTLSSCCTLATDPKYTAPKTREITTTYISGYTKPYIWDKTIDFLSDIYSPYTINEIDYNQGTITFSYSGDPCPNVDCGELVADFTMPFKNSFYHKEPACSEYLTYTTCDEEEVPCGSVIKRSMHLETSTTIVLTPFANGVRVDIMTIYMLSKEIMIHDDQGLFRGHRFDEITFPTHSTGQFPETPSICKATGNIESSILELAK